MPHEKTTLVYKYDELSDEAKAKARDKWRETECTDNWWYEYVFDDACSVAAILGITIDTRKVKLMGGGESSKPAIYFSGFSSQGDGACFAGIYAYAKGCREKIREYAPVDSVLHCIADRLAALQRKHFYRLEAIVKHTGHYCHSHSTSIDVFDRADQYGRDIGPSHGEVEECLRRFMDWIYRQLERYFDYLMSDECIEESIKCNEVEFNEDGGLA